MVGDTLNSYCGGMLGLGIERNFIFLSLQDVAAKWLEGW